MKLSPDQLAKASTYSFPQELVDAAAKAGIDCSIEQAEAILSSNEMTELSEDDIDLVSGGCEPTIDENGYQETSGSGCEQCPNCDSQQDEHDYYILSGIVYNTCKRCSKKWKYLMINS